MSLKSEKNVIISLLEFKNINIMFKGQYRLQFQVFIGKQPLNINYKFQNQNLQKFDHLNQTSVKGECSQQQAGSTVKQQIEKRQLNSKIFQTLPFYIKYYNQKIKMNYLCLFSGEIEAQIGFIRIILQKKDKDKKKQCEAFTNVQQVLVSFDPDQIFVQYFQCSFAQPFSSVIKLVIVSSPIFQIRNKLGTQNNNASKLLFEQTQLIEFRKQIKKYRYKNYLFGKAIDQILLNPVIKTLKLPLFFVTKQHSMDQVDSNEKMFFKYLTVYQKTQTNIEMLEEQIQHLALNRRCIFKYFIDAFQKGQLLQDILQQKTLKNKSQKYKNFVIQTQLNTSLNDLLKIIAKEQIQFKKDKIKEWKKSLNKKLIQINQNIKVKENITFIQLMKTKDINLQKHQVQFPLIFLEKFQVYQSQEQKHIQSIKLMIKTFPIRKIFIFAHGFQGLPSDLFFIMNQIKKKYYKSKFLVLKSYKNKMQTSIQQMAKKIAFQITQFIQALSAKQVQDQIIMIGHSMGSIILRTSLKYLQKYKKKMQSFISLCSPHLGYIQGTKFLTETGLSLISKIKPIQSLLQVSNRDNSNIQQTFIFELSKSGSLTDFKQLILVSSIEDNYVPWHSARIQPYNQEKGKGWIQRQMIANILGIDNPQSKIKKILRVDVHFQNSNKCFTQLDSWIGRVSHIKPLVDSKFLQIFVNKILCQI